MKSRNIIRIIGISLAVIAAVLAGATYVFAGDINPVPGKGGGSGPATSTNPLMGSYVVATSTTASQFPYASTTAISVSNLSAGNCVQAGTGGLLTTIIGACGSGGAGSNFWTISGSNLFPNSGSLVQAPQYQATSTIASIFPYASTTAVTFVTASSSNYFGGNLIACSGASNALTWGAGLFGCNTITPGSNFFSNLLANTFLNTGINLQAPNLQATSTSGINYFVSNTAVGTTTSHFPLDVASSTGNTLGGSAQLVLTDTNAGANLKHWGFTSESGHLYLGQITDLNATTTNPALSFNPNNGNVGINSPNPIAGLEVGGTFRISAPSEAGVGTRGINFTAGTAGNNSALNNINNGAILIETTPTTSGVISAQEVINPFSGFNFNTSVSPAGVVNRMNILSTGQVQINTILQIGTTSSPWLLDVAGNSSQAAFDNGQLVLTDTNAGANLKHFQETYESGTFYMGPVTDLYASTSPYLTILNGGNTGHGTSTPSQMLSVQGNTLISGNITSVSSITATSSIVDTGTASSTFAGGIDAARVCLQGTTTCLAPSSGGTVTSVATGNGLTGGPIANSGTISVNSTGLVTNTLTTWNGSNFVATGTPTLTTGQIFATSTASSTLVGPIVSPCFSTDNNTCLNNTYASASAYKQASNYATTGSLPTNTYNNGASGIGATLTEVGTGALVVDGASPVIGNRILVKNESAGANNGIYVVTATGSGIAAYVLTRSTDFNSPADVFPGVATYILGGTANIDDIWALSNTSAVTIGSTALTFSEITATPAVSSVSNSDGSLTVTPTTGAVVASINSAHGNHWTAATQNFDYSSSTQHTQLGPLYDSTNSAGTSGQVYTSQGAGSAPLWQASGGGSLTTTVFATSSNINGPGVYKVATSTSVNANGQVLVWAACGGLNNPNTQIYNLLAITKQGTTTMQRMGFNPNGTSNADALSFFGDYVATTSVTVNFKLTFDGGSQDFTAGNDCNISDSFLMERMQ